MPHGWLLLWYPTQLAFTIVSAFSVRTKPAAKGSGVDHYLFQARHAEKRSSGGDSALRRVQSRSQWTATSSRVQLLVFGPLDDASIYLRSSSARPQEWSGEIAARDLKARG